MAKRRIQLIGSFPIPVGHEVEIIWYREERLRVGLLGEKIVSDDVEAPCIEDRTTGIRWGVFKHYSDGEAIRTGSLNVSSHELRDALKVRERVAGTVRRCSIVDIRFEGARDHIQWETELELDVAD